MKIILIGFMGAGKSSVASVLAKKLKIKLIELDDLVLKRSGRRSINEVFIKDGEQAFRQFEYEEVINLKNSANIIISAGGGVVQSISIMNALKKDSYVIYLETQFEKITERLSGDSTRPLFLKEEKARQLYESRKNLYKKYADKTISTDNKNIEEVAEEIIKVVN